MKLRAAALRAGAAPAKRQAARESEAKACDATTAAPKGIDEIDADLLDTVVAHVAPQLEPKTWYGFPSYAREGKVVVFFKPASKFDTRYGTIGFSHDVHLDGGTMWATEFAVVEVDEAVRKRLTARVKKAAD